MSAELSTHIYNTDNQAGIIACGADMIRVLIVNENRLMANIIASVLEDENGIEVVGVSHSFEEAKGLLKEHATDVILLSINMQKENALLITKQLNTAQDEINVVVYGLKDHEDQILPFLEAGADGIIKEKDNANTLINTIRMAQDGKTRLSPEMTRSLIDRITQLSHLNTDLSTDSIPTHDLTQRELEVLECIGNDMTNKEIAKKLFIEVGTVKNHVHHILDKLNVNTRSEASQFLMFTNRPNS